MPEYLAAARKSMSAEAAAEFEKNCREMYDEMARIAIVPNWVRFYDFGTGRVPKFLKELAEQNRSYLGERQADGSDPASTWGLSGFG